MIGSPLQMSRYFVTDCQVTAAKHFKPKDGVVLNADLLSLEPSFQALENERQWEITLRAKFQPGPKVNAPYFFVLEIVGFFQVEPQYPPERLDALVRVNGPSVLYGVAREIIRDLTCRGPYPPMFLPSASFVENARAKQRDAAAPPSSTKKRRVRNVGKPG